jgi:hypothetical protein
VDRTHLTAGQSGAEADVRVRIRATVVAVRIEHAGVGAIVPVATAVEGPSASRKTI